MKTVEVRSQLTDALQLDLIGPGHEEPAELREELLSQDPSRWYLTGFLVPRDASERQKSDETADDEFNLAAGESDATDDATPPDPPASRRAYFPSSIGMSVLIPPNCKELTITARWGDYRAEGLGGAGHGAEKAPQDGWSVDAGRP